jgi:hypothetical protein
LVVRRGGTGEKQICAGVVGWCGVVRWRCDGEGVGGYIGRLGWRPVAGKVQMIGFDCDGLAVADTGTTSKGDVDGLEWRYWHFEIRAGRVDQVCFHLVDSYFWKD